MGPLLAGLALAVQISSPVATDPARAPQMAVSGRTVALTFGAGESIYVSMSNDEGAHFAPPVKVSNADLLPLSRHRGPRIAFSGNTIVITAVSGKQAAEGPHAHGLPSDGDLLVWRSADSGKTWKRIGRVNDVPGAPTEGLHSLTADKQGRLFAAWLDKRSGSGTALYGSQSSDAGITWSKNVKIYESAEGTICECCHPSAIFDNSGEVLVMFRNWLGGARDMYLARSRDGVHFAKAEKLGQGTWELNACPMDGGGLVATQDRVVTAWRRDGQVFLASPGEKEVSIGKGVDITLASTPAGLYTAWSNTEGVFVSTPGSKTPVALATKGGFPNVVGLASNHALVSWESDGMILTRELR